MTKKQSKTVENNQRQSRKEVLIARKQEQQTRRVWIFVIAVIVLIFVVMMIGIVNELMLKPAKPVATVGGVEIPMKDWRDQVEYQRALLVSRVTDIADLVGGDVEQIQQIAQFELQALSDPEILGQQVLDEMIDDQLIRKEAAARGISVTDAEVQNSLEERFLYFDGESPTPQPNPTETVMPTPSLTPISQEPVTDTAEVPIPTPVTLPGATATPLPSPTPVSLESFQESLDTWYERLGDYGISSGLFRNDIESTLYRDRLVEALAEENSLSDEAEHVSIFYIRFDDEAEANSALDDIESSDYLTVWNTIKSLRDQGESDSTAFSGELLWRTYDNLEGILGQDLRTAVEELDLEEPSSVLVVPSQAEEGADAYFIVMVSGREIRPLSEAAFNNIKQQNLLEWLESARLEDVVTFERWRANIPQRPLLDTRNWIYPTPVPTPTEGGQLEPVVVPTP